MNRFEYEFKTIVDMGYIDYFLIVWDFIKFAKDNEIMVGPGRISSWKYCILWFRYYRYRSIKIWINL